MRRPQVSRGCVSGAHSSMGGIMRVAVFVKATKSSETGVMPSTELLEAMGQFNEELVKAGVMKDGAGLHPSTKGVRIRFSGANRTVINGPFVETRELVSGYWLWEVPSLEAAIDWVKRCPNPMPEESEIEIRPLFEAADFGEAYTPELQAHEKGLVAAVSMQTASVQPYLFFGGRCEEALEFYKAAVNAQVKFVMRFNESPDPVPEGLLQPGFEKKVMHCEFQVGTSTLMASDSCDDKVHFDGFKVALSVPTEADANRVFAALSVGGSIEMPLTQTFWSPRFGMLKDKFGLQWMIMVPGADRA